MKVSFTKYQGTGNDFILVDDRSEHFPQQKQIIQRLCHRKFGIGADGLILIQNHPTHDYRMIYFNADGSQSLCGNGSRCGFSFAQSLGMVSNHALFETTDGVHEIKQENKLIHFHLFDVQEVNQLNTKEWYVNTGSPHHILLIPNGSSPDIVAEGKKIRYSSQYARQNGTNVNFAQLLQKGVEIRTYERGVEDETLSCGTGATAAGLVAGRLGYKSPVTVRTQGGELIVYFKQKANQFTDIWLAGPTEKVFEGSVTI